MTSRVALTEINRIHPSHEEAGHVRLAIVEGDLEYMTLAWYRSVECASGGTPWQATLGNSAPADGVGILPL